VSWDAIGALGEIFGGIAVLLTLIYLAAQVRHANELATFDASTERMNQLNRLVAPDSELRRTLLETEDLSEDDVERVYNFAMMFCNVWYSVQAAYENGQIERDFYLAGCKVVELDRWPPFRAGVEEWLTRCPEMAGNAIFEPAVPAMGSPAQPQDQWA